MGGPGPLVAIVRNPFAAIAAATIFLRFVMRGARGPWRTWIVRAAPLAAIVPRLIEPSTAPPVLQFLDLMCAVGALGLLGFIGQTIVGDGVRRQEHVDELLDAVMLPVSASMVSFGLWASSHVNPVYDPTIYAFEEILGLKFSIIGVRTYHALAPLSSLAGACYMFLACGIVLAALGQPTTERARAVLAASIVAGACGFALYFLCPVVGPLQAFAPEYPRSLPTIAAVPSPIEVPTDAPRNGMPSLHTVWALIIWFNAAALKRRPSRAALRVFAALTIWAAMGLDDTHWFSDIVVAVPLAVAVQAAVVEQATASLRGRITVAACAAMTALWLLAFRQGSVILGLPRVAAWTLIIATVVWPLVRRGLATRVDRQRDSDNANAGVVSMAAADA